MASLKLVCVLFMCIVVAAPLFTEAAISCPQIQGALVPCLAYLRKGGYPVPGCCGGVKSMVKSAKTTADRRDACNCLKSVANKIPGINAGNAAKLPSLCGVNIPYKISTSTNCATVK